MHFSKDNPLQKFISILLFALFFQFCILAMPAWAAVSPTITAQPAAQAAEVGQSASFSVTAVGTGTLSYQWQKNGVPISGSTGATLNIPDVQGVNSGSYSAVVSDSAGNSVTSNAATLTVIDITSLSSITASSIAVDSSGKIYVVDTGTGTNTIKRMDADGTNIVTLGSGIVSPVAIAVDGSGKIYVADAGTNTIKRMDADGTNIVTLASGFSIDSGVANPCSVAVDSSGKIYVEVAGDGTIKRMDADGTNIVTLVSGFYNIAGVAVDSNGRIYFLDKNDNTIKRTNADGTNIVTLASGFSMPIGIALDSSGRIYVADPFNNAILRMDADGTNIVTLGSGYSIPYGVAVDSSGNIYVADNSAIKKIQTIYGVTYNSNGSDGGSVPTDVKNYVYGQNVTVLGNTGNLVKTGYTFAGWSTATTGSAISYQSGDTFTMGEDTVTLYAQWNPVKTLVNITTPAAITGVANGTAKTASALGLPSTVTMVTDRGNVQANVIWNVDSCAYAPSSTTAQAFTISGTVTLPAGVVNTNNVPLTTSISVSVNAVQTSAYALTITAGSGGTITEGSSGNYAAGDIISLAATADSNYSFNGWTSSNGGTFADSNRAATTFTMPAGATTLTAAFTYNGASGGSGSGGSSGSSSGGSSVSSGGTTVTGSVVDGTTGANVSNLTGTVTTDSNGNYTVSLPAAQTVTLQQPDGTVSPLSDLTKVSYVSAGGSSISVSADGTVDFSSLVKGTDNQYKITYDLGNGQTVTLGTLEVTVSSSGTVSLKCTLIDPYGIITDAATGKPIAGAKVTLYYADTERNKTNGKTPDTVVTLPGIDGIKPNNNQNPQTSDALGAYGFMVFPNTDYYIAASKDGYETYTSPTISVGQELVHWDFKMSTPVTGVRRLAGQSQVDTALAIAKANYTGTLSNVVLATADNYPDALAGSVLAYKLNAPILLVGSSEADQEKVLDYLKANLAPTENVYILGGTAVVSADMEDQIKAEGFSQITRLGGTDLYDTCSKIADQLQVKSGTPIVLAYGGNYPDALSISSIAAENQYPILLVQKDGISDVIKSEIATIKPSKVFIIGGEGVISSAVESQVEQITSLDKSNIIRIAGQDRYATSLAVTQYFNLAGQSICVATGNNFPDALAGSVYAANHNTSIILADGSLSDQVVNYLKGKKLTGATIFGGETVVSQGIEQQLGQLIGN
ncbi:N-acetylmuramoyl-L-alanine amidase LytC precursor [Desulfosporosinus acididurans]|uniref:N-acetylmuramoyl-L-alanine amidase LytC n=1 Tax=Desulfosporosinus acididurans TaxID=476652 RepID=A0A0J1FR66_9FIRM|nr:cell wall-binding repeat-containing protein [Desulfosporosinus acididurans]KLU65792.1 N-acetylmuramoyl-L-alanine amidase LytC precursor [Desulfosporosinus acididurans]